MSRSDKIMKLLRDGADPAALFAAIRIALRDNTKERHDLLDLLDMAERRHGKQPEPVGD